MSERVSDKDLQEMLDVMDGGESYLSEEDIEAALRDLVDARSGAALKAARHRIAELEQERGEATTRLYALTPGGSEYVGDLLACVSHAEKLHHHLKETPRRILAAEHRIAELERERATVLSMSWRVFPDWHGENGETWAQAFADLDMVRMELDGRIAELERERSVREPVRWFAERMEEQLCANDHKGGWQDESDAWLYERLLKEADELITAVEAFPCDREKITREAADVANFAMMIADAARAEGRRNEQDNP